jgi:hypothetical protein
VKDVGKVLQDFAFGNEFRNDNVYDGSALPVGAEQKTFPPWIHRLHGDQSPVNFESQFVHLCSCVPGQQSRPKADVVEGQFMADCGCDSVPHLPRLLRETAPSIIATTKRRGLTGQCRLEVDARFCRSATSGGRGRPVVCQGITGL